MTMKVGDIGILQNLKQPWAKLAGMGNGDLGEIITEPEMILTKGYHKYFAYRVHVITSITREKRVVIQPHEIRPLEGDEHEESTEEEKEVVLCRVTQ